ncbi:helix-turn-helix domain-containing protein [Asinibacterium sp. OR53]|uniref:helix-turn-helix domain-containing protein n=1 Tax=Asinibacterium sp. OR53 TaxID=925409 RepID=UPI00047E3B34|nr:helix-turn-helix domain-containing protein [Asinibacterium sp. OR53]
MLTIHVSFDELKQLVRDTINQCFIDFVEKTSTYSDLITIDELTARLKCSKPTIYNWKKKGLLGCQKIGSKVLYNWAEIQEMMRQNPSAFDKGKAEGFKFNAQASDFEKEKRRYSYLKSKKLLDPLSLAYDDLLFIERGKALYE